jgi:hypothetical protein
MVKIYPALLLAFFVLKRQFRVMVAFAISCFLLVAVSGIFTGWVQMWRYVTEVLLVPTPAVPSPENHSLNGFVSRLFVPGPGVQVGLAVPFPAWAMLLWVLLSAAILIATLAFVWRVPANDRLGNGLQFASLFSLMLLLWPRSWIHYETLLLFPFAVLLVSFRTRQKSDWLVALVAVVTFLFLAFGDEDTVSGAAFCCGVASLARSYKVYSIIVLWILCLAAAWRQKNSMSHDYEIAAKQLMIGEAPSPIALATNSQSSGHDTLPIVLLRGNMSYAERTRKPQLYNGSSNPNRWIL